ncbi:MAG: hypothetical protein RIC19_08145 [Phaeodactylibacter sp.]|uniref:hypothetical protein n=1 Tax=Phaeodactylibacter sp. TaxID=1940289 RepID=UPI0032EC16F8
MGEAGCFVFGGIFFTINTAFKAQIDLLVYRLYGLSWAEVKLRDPAFGMGEVEYEAVEV